MPREVPQPDHELLRIFEATAAELDAPVENEGKDNRLGLAIKDFDPARKVQFVKWYVARKKAVRDARMTEHPAKPALTRQAFVRALGQIDFAVSDTVHRFKTAITTIGHQPSPDPIVLGYEDDLVFFIQPGTGSIYVRDDTSQQGELHPYYVKFRATRGRHPYMQLLFGMYLGPLLSYDRSLGDLNTMDKSTMIQRATETRLQAFLRPTDKSIWLVVAEGGFENFNGFDTSVNDAWNGWTAAGLKQNGRKSFDVVRLEGIRLAIDSVPRLLPDTVLETAEVAHLLVYPVTLNELALMTLSRRTDGDRVGVGPIGSSVWDPSTPVGD